MRDAVFVHEHGVVRYANPAMASLLGFGAPSELLGQDGIELFVHPDDREATLEYVRRRGTGEELGILSTRWVRRDGTTVHVEATSTEVSFEGGDATVVVVRDVTAQTADAAERTRLADQLRQSQKMEALGQFAGGIAHDFNNILAVILGDADFIRGELGEAHALNAEVGEIEAAARRGAALTAQMLTFSRQQPSAPCLLSLNERVADLGKMLARIIGEDIRLETTLDPRLGSIEADPGQVDQVLLNLTVNARDAMPRGGTLGIQTAGIDLSAAEARQLGMEAGRCARLVVADTGVGMDAATRARLFEPFFTTKEVGKGTGLGLATVFGIVKRARGAIAVESEPGRGSTFRFFFPQTPEALRPSERLRVARPATTETILLVEDEEPVRRVVRRLLASVGYRVLEASGAVAVFEIFARPGPLPDLVLTDLVMPNMDGQTMVNRLRVRFPDVRVLFMSGYTDHATLKGAVLGASEQLIRKPFTGAEITSAVRSALTSQRSGPTV
jgi:two-component system, cell cycle sensor histidine kinase and response regulator CckA